MTKYFFISILCTAFAIQANSQNDSLGLNEYGINADVHVPRFPDRFRSTLGHGVGAYINYQFNREYSLLLRANYRRINHNNLDLNQTFEFRDVSLTMAAGFSLEELANTKLLVGIQPTRIISPSFGLAGQLTSPLENLNSLNLFGGIQIDLNSYTKLELSYTQPIKRTGNNAYIDAIPPMISLGLSTNFNTLGNRVSHWREMKKTLNKLENDTLYFINRACEGELTDQRLNELLAQHFTYCAYRVLTKNELEEGKGPTNAVHYAVIGQFYAGSGEPLTVGLYLLDSEMHNVQFPYDPYVPIYNSNLNCMGAEKNIISGIVRFSNSLSR